MTYVIVFLLSFLLGSSDFKVRNATSIFLESFASVYDVRSVVDFVQKRAINSEMEERLNPVYNAYYKVNLKELVYLQDLGIYPFHGKWDTIYASYDGGSPSVKIDSEHGLSYTDYSYKFNHEDAWNSTEKAIVNQKEVMENYIAQLAYEKKIDKFKIIKELTIKRDMKMLIGGIGYTPPK